MTSNEAVILFARDALGIPVNTPVELRPLSARGSDREFFRLVWNAHASAVLIRYDPRRIENCFYADIATFLNEIGVPVPRLIAHSPEHHLVLVEDLGDRDLWSLRGIPWQKRCHLYEKALMAIRRLHSFPERDFPHSRVRLMEAFSPQLYRMEQIAFLDRFVRGYCRIQLGEAFLKHLEKELALLTERLMLTPRCLIHRDLQSQNIMISRGKVFFIDFQGMRFGSPFYDLASLIWDPYAKLSEAEMKELLSFSYSLFGQKLDIDTFEMRFNEAAVERLMQALSAFGFLGLKKGLTHYLEHIPTGILYLEEATSRVPFLSALREMVVKCKAFVEQEGSR